jgi:hypothetical protein
MRARFSLNIFSRFALVGGPKKVFSPGLEPALGGRAYGKNIKLEFRDITSFFSCLSRAKESIVPAVPHYVTIFLTQGMHKFSENLGAISEV